MNQVPSEARRFEPLAKYLEALSSPTRLQLLSALRRPKALHEISAAPSLSRGDENPDRPLTRQAVTHHLEQLQKVGLVRRLPSPEPGRGEAFVLNHERLFAMVDEIRSLARLRPLVTEGAQPGSTLAGALGSEPRLPETPRLYVAYGREDGSAFPLHGPVGTEWRIGRGAACEVRLDYDPYVSTENSLVTRTQAGFSIKDLPQSRNGTWINTARLPSGSPRPLRPGDVVAVGRSTLVFQA